MTVSTVYLVPMTASRQLMSMRGSSATSRAALARSERPCRRPVSFSGLPGVSSHQTRSSFRRFSANWLMARCAACGGLNEPPSRPMRMPLVWKGMACAAVCDCISRVTACTGLKSRPRLPGTVNAIFEARQLLGADRAAGVEFAGGNPDFRAEAELAAVGELCRCVVQHDRGLDRTADAGTAHLGIEHDLLRHFEIGRAIDIDVVDAFEMRENRHAGFRLDACDEALATARHDHVDAAVQSGQHQPNRGAVARRH